MLEADSTLLRYRRGHHTGVKIIDLQQDSGAASDLVINMKAADLQRHFIKAKVAQHRINIAGFFPQSGDDRSCTCNSKSA